MYGHEEKNRKVILGGAVVVLALAGCEKAEKSTGTPKPTESVTTENQADGTGMQNPTQAPTDGTPTATPTDSATPTDGTPTPNPTATPTDGTQKPTDSATPTEAPTDAPMSTPTSTPTQAPTSAPTNTPTNAPTPTQAPTPTPSGDTSGGTKVSGWVSCIGDASDIRIPTLDKFNSEGLSSKYRGNHNPGYWNAIGGGEFEEAWSDARDALDRKYSGVQGADGTWYIIGGSTDTDYGPSGTGYLGYGALRGPATAQWIGDVMVCPSNDGSAYGLTYTLDLSELSNPTLWRNETILLLATIVPNPKEVEDAIFQHMFGDQSKSPFPRDESIVFDTWVKIGDVEAKLQYVNPNPVVVEYLIREAK